MQSNHNPDDAGTNDLQFTTSIDGSIRQDVPIPPVPTHATVAENAEYGNLSGQMNSIRSPSSSSSQPTTTSGGGSGPLKMNALSHSAHPTVCIFHIIFKLSAILLYIFGGWFFNESGANFITITVCCILLLAADFWVVKNVTGRLLVGLRWWNKVEEDGSATRWIFESAEVANRNTFDNAVFWWVLYGTPALWCGLFVIGFLKLEIGWLITVAMAIGLSGANLYGYWKCSSDQKVKFQRLMAKGAEMGAMGLIRNNLFGFLSGAAAGGGGGGQGGPSPTTYV